MTRTALLTGGSGFVGQWLGRALLKRGWAVHSVGLTGGGGSTVLGDEERRSIVWHEADLRDADRLDTALDASRPDLIVHLAAVSFVPAAAAASVDAYDVNVLGVARLLETVRPRRASGTLDPTFLVIGSGEQYGRHDEADLPLREDAAQLPLTVYAASKAAQEQIALQAFRAEGLRIVATRSFNHSGPGQSPRFLLPALVDRVRRLPARGGALALGNTTPIRDYLHVGDVADAYCHLAEHGVAGEVYNVSSGSGISVGSLAERVLQLAGVRADISQDPSLVRPVDLPALVGSPQKVQGATGWSPRRTIDDIIEDLLRTHNAPSR